MLVSKLNFPNWEQGADFLGEFIKIKNDQGEIAAKGQN